MSIFPRFSSLFGERDLSRDRFSDFGQDIFRAFEDAFSNNSAFPRSMGFIPAADFKESKSEFEITMDVPGMKKDQIDLEFVDQSTLEVKGSMDSVVESHPQIEANKKRTQVDKSNAVAEQNTERQLATNSDDSKIWSIERRSGAFRRLFTFPQKVDHDQVKASLEHGILKIIVPKLEDAQQRRKITVN